jgi:hypothetical protein
VSLPVCYAMHYLRMAARARELGYALALHGSLTRDADMVAVPWTDAAVPAEELAAAMIEESGGFIVHREDADPYDYTRRNPQPKPHGRLAWSIHLGGGPYIDLSVTPRLHPATTPDRSGDG